jgi:hypothetical protein
MAFGKLKERLRRWKWAQAFFQPELAAKLDNAWKSAADNFVTAQALQSSLMLKQKEFMSLTADFHRVIGALVLAHGGNTVHLSQDLLSSVDRLPWPGFHNTQDGGVLVGFWEQGKEPQLPEPTDEELRAIEREQQLQGTIQ